MSEAKPLRIAVRFPPYANASWRERCLASLDSVADVELSSFSDADPPRRADLVVDLSTRAVDARHLMDPPLGYWTLVYGEEPERFAPGAQEFLAGRRAAHVRLVQLVRPDSARLLREGVVKVIGHSLGATRRRLLDTVADWPARALKERLREKEPGRQTARLEGRALRLRSRGPVARLILYLRLPFAWIRNVFSRAIREATREHWAVGVIAEPVQRVCQSFDPAKIRWLPPPPDGFLADPFAVAYPDGRLVILAEALSWQEGRGRIVAFESGPDGGITPLQEVFAFTTHASYPQLIEHDGAIYCIPETLQQRRVQLFRADPFPHRWIPDTVLLENFAGADATVCFHEGRWWLFVCDHDDQDETKLFIFHASALRGPWLPHAANPVKCDLRSARPAGPLFVMENQLHRPAQDCSVTYGGAISINRITRLNANEFAEETVTRLAPAANGPYPHGLHTLSGAGHVTLVDGKREALSAASLRLRLQHLGKSLSLKLNRARHVI